MDVLENFRFFAVSLQRLAAKQPTFSNSWLSARSSRPLAKDFDFNRILGFFNGALAVRAHALLTFHVGPCKRQSFGAAWNCQPTAPR